LWELNITAAADLIASGDAEVTEGMLNVEIDESRGKSVVRTAGFLVKNAYICSRK
jgi:hypothetical protein